MAESSRPKLGSASTTHHAKRVKCVAADRHVGDVVGVPDVGCITGPSPSVVSSMRVAFYSAAMPANSVAGDGPWSLGGGDDGKGNESYLSGVTGMSQPFFLACSSPALAAAAASKVLAKVAPGAVVTIHNVEPIMYFDKKPSLKYFPQGYGMTANTSFSVDPDGHAIDDDDFRMVVAASTVAAASGPGSAHPVRGMFDATTFDYCYEHKNQSVYGNVQLLVRGAVTAFNFKHRDGQPHAQFDACVDGDPNMPVVVKLMYGGDGFRHNAMAALVHEGAVVIGYNVSMRGVSYGDEVQVTVWPGGLMLPADYGTSEAVAENYACRSAVVAAPSAGDRVVVGSAVVVSLTWGEVTVHITDGSGCVETCFVRDASIMDAMFGKIFVVDTKTVTMSKMFATVTDAAARSRVRQAAKAKVANVEVDGSFAIGEDDVVTAFNSVTPSDKQVNANPPAVPNALAPVPPTPGESSDANASNTKSGRKGRSFK